MRISEMSVYCVPRRQLLKVFVCIIGLYLCIVLLTAVIVGCLSHDLFVPSLFFLSVAQLPIILLVVVPSTISRWSSRVETVGHPWATLAVEVAPEGGSLPLSRLLDFWSCSSQRRST